MASIRWVRPAFTISANSVLLFSKVLARCSKVGIRFLFSSVEQAMCTEVGKTSFDDCDAFTWSLGCILVWVLFWGSFWFARFAITSFMFMLEDVPEPVWNMSTGNSFWCFPEIISSVASMIAFVMWGGTMFSSVFVMAAAFFILANDCMCVGVSVFPLMGKFSVALWVCAPYRAVLGT